MPGTQMEAAHRDEDSHGLLSPITAAADRSEPTTILVSEGSGLPRVLQQAFEDSLSARPALLALSPIGKSRAARLLA